MGWHKAFEIGSVVLLLLALGACRQTPNAPRVPLDFNTDPRILRGVWTGEAEGVSLLLDLDASAPTAEGYAVTGSFQLDDAEPVVIEGYVNTSVTVPVGSSARLSDPSATPFDAVSVQPGWRLTGLRPELSPPRFGLFVSNESIAADDQYFEVTAQGETALDGSEWALESLRGDSLVAGKNITLEFGDQPHEGFSGYDGCNYYGARHLASATTFDIVYGIGSTAMACESEALSAQATAYTSALSDATTYRVADGRLEFATAEDKTVLVFTDTEQPPMNPADLLGTAWRLLEANGQSTPQGAEMTLAFPRARVLRGTAGCESYYGVYDASGNDLYLSQIGATYDACAEGEQLEGLEAAYSDYLSTASDFWLEGGGLKLYTRQGDVLVFEEGP